MINHDSHAHPPRSRRADRAPALVPFFHRPTTAIVALLLLLLCSCGGTSLPAQTPAPTSGNQSNAATPSASPASLERINWRNYTYHSSCYGNTRPFHAHNGVAVNNGIHFTVYAPYFGELTGDANAEAIVPYQCSAADTGGKHVFVYGGTAAHPVLLADLPGAHANNTLDNVMQVSVKQGALYLTGVGYSAGTPRCCPDLAIQNSYRWNGSTFVLVRSVVHKR